uniref:Mammalian defensins domain-containing protein n=1 Tax=Papio anubis TaxID=9555 RepID=A0A8I5NLF4_PAPAN
SLFVFPFPEPFVFVRWKNLRSLVPLRAPFFSKKHPGLINKIGSQARRTCYCRNSRCYTPEFHSGKCLFKGLTYKLCCR